MLLSGQSLNFNFWLMNSRFIPKILFVFITTISFGQGDISGTIYEDVAYGGGLGRNLATASGIGRT